eukprot:tig00021726_g23266.t1
MTSLEGVSIDWGHIQHVKTVVSTTGSWVAAMDPNYIGGRSMFPGAFSISPSEPVQPLSITSSLNIVGHMGYGSFHAAGVHSSPLKCTGGSDSCVCIKPAEIMDSFLLSDEIGAVTVRSRVTSSVGAFLAPSSCLRFTSAKTAIPLSLFVAHTAMRDATFVGLRFINAHLDVR